MAFNNGAMTFFTFFCALLMGLIIGIDSSVIKRREIATTLQQNDENQEKPTTIATLRLQPTENESVVMTIKSTKLMPQAAIIENLLPNTTTDFQTPQTSKKTTLHSIHNVRDPQNDGSEIEKEDKKHLKNESKELLISTTATILNAIETEQETKVKLKSIPYVVHKLENVPTTVVPTLTTITLPPTTAAPISIVEVVSTKDSLFEDKSKISLEENASNDLQLSSNPKQAKFLNDNSTNSNSLNLPNTADVWTLAGMKTISTRSNDNNFTESSKHSIDSTIELHPVKEKTLTDWTQIVQMGVDKSVGNALTEDHNHHHHSSFDDEELITSTANSTIHKLDNVTNSRSNLKPYESTNPTSLATTVSTNATEFLSINDNAGKSVIVNNSTENLDEEQTHTQREKRIEEKIMKNEEHEEHEETSTSSSQPQYESPTTMKMMTTISTPATASVSTTESTLKEHIDGFESEKDNKDVKGTADEFGTTTTTTTKLNLATIADEVVNLIISTTPDTHQIGTTKSDLETTTTTIEELEGQAEDEKGGGGEKANIEATSTPTPIVQSLNSSAVVNQTLTQEKGRKDEAEDEDISDKDLVNVRTSTTDSLLNEPTTSTSTVNVVEAETTITPIETKVIETTPKIVESAAVAKDTTLVVTTTTTKANAFDFNETTEPNNVITTLPTLEIPTVRIEQSTTSIFEEGITSITTIAPRQVEMNNETIFAVTESTGSDATLTNFIDDTTTTSTSTATSTATAKEIPISTISPTTIAFSTTIPPVETTHIEDIETTLIITEETPTETTTTTTDFLNAETTSSTLASNTNIELITTTELPEEITEKPKEMVPVAVPTTSSLPSTSSSSPPLTTTTETATTLNPFPFPAGTAILNAQPPKSTADSPETDVNVVIAISVSVIGVIALVLLVAFLYLMRKRQKATSYGQRCRPVSLDAYSLDNVSVLGSVRRKVALRASKRTYGNAAFDDPSLRHHVIQSAAELAKFVERRSSIFEEFRDVPQIIARPEEIPEGCENKNRYANVIPLPETRVILQRRNDDDTSEYINANYVRGPKDAPNYYIACQAPLESTVQDFWRMIWEQQSRVIIQATDLIENGVEKCAEYLPPSATLDNHTTFGDFQVLLKNREVKDKYAISTIMLKNTINNTSREITHYWYKWPEIGVPSEEAPIIAMLLEARSSLKSYALEVTNELKEKSNSDSAKDGENAEEKTLTTSVNGAGSSGREINGNVTEKSKTISRNQGPLTIHCSPGTGRTGTIIGCDMAIRSLESTKSLDIPQILYYIRRGRASSVQTKEQYEFIYKVSNVYAMKITNVPSDN